jgi:ATP-dependent DNA helicase RecG
MTSSKIEDISGVGETVAKKLGILGIKTIGDLIDFYPRRYEDYSRVSDISKLRDGQNVTIKAKITSIKGRYARRGLHVTEAMASDATSSARVVWFNQPYREKNTKIGKEYFISGPFELSAGRRAIMNPSMELVSDFPLSTARIVPVYRETKGLKSNRIRQIIGGIRSEIKNLPETLPHFVRSQSRLVTRPEAILNIHFPRSSKELDEAKRRVGFEEIFILSLASLLNKSKNQKDKGLKVKFDEKIAKRFVRELPYDLTGDQRKTIWQIYKDMQNDTPANRLVEGDVGSGKTVVAAMAAVMALSQNLQVALMAPTEILARQHAENLREMLRTNGLADEVILLVGSMKPSQKKNAHASIKKGKAKMIIGTHALISEKVDMHKLGLVVVDEQHRFGVDQRKALQKKAGHMPHVLSMTATPIPRSLALTLYGELDISVIAQMPPGRKSPITKTVSPNSKKQLYAKIDKELDAGRQMFVVCPLISESDVLGFLSAEEVYKDLSSRHFKHRKIGLLHGKMKPEDKESTMGKFASGELDILVSTTVIEVGIHVPNASVMLIEGVERFGLAQIHQLRGRVGRSGHQGYCYLLTSDSKAPSQRIRALEYTTDGFKLAELDLQLRGPGAIYGAAQHGQLDLRMANLSDTKLIAAARNAAQGFIESEEKLSDYPQLDKAVSESRSVTNLN